MSITVTATETAGAFEGLLMRVVVLTGQKSANPIGNNGASVNNPLTTDLTTTQAGSRVYGAVQTNFSSATLVAASGTTLIDNISDTHNNAAYGSLKSATTVTPGPETLGATNASQGTLALLEILAGPNGLNEDASAPAMVWSSTASTVTTASFTPPPDSLLVALVAGEGDGANTTTVSVSDTSGMRWTQQSIGNGPADGYSGVWTAFVPPNVFLFSGSEADANLYGGSIADANKYGGMFTDAHLYGGFLTDTNLYGGSVAPCIMQNVNITLGEYNDEVVNLAITNNGSAFNLTGFNLQVLLKVNQGDSDTASTTKLYSSSGGSPPITITNAAGGLATLKIPRADISNTSFTFWRCDVLDGSGDQNTALYGSVTMTKL